MIIRRHTPSSRFVRPAAAGLLALALLAALPALRAQAPQADPIRYTLSFPEPHTHYVEVEAVVPTADRTEVELMMAVWTPGSYMIREYARHVENVGARTPGGRALAVEKSSKNRWRIVTGGEAAIVVSYRVYAREMSVRTNWVEDDFAMLNGAPTFLTLADAEGPRPHDVRIVLPPGWNTVATGLPAAPTGGPHHYRAADFDTLVDSPIVAGNPAVYEFEVGGKPHWLVNVGGAGAWDGPRAATDVARIVREHLRMWGSLPYDRYVILNMITEAGGGLEHRNSTLLMTSRWAMSTRQAYLGWLGLVAHEVFHIWNGKGLRPIELGPFDYERENYTTGLWMVEGFTSYFGDLLVHRAGLSSQAEYLAGLSNTIRSLQSTPGRLVQSVERAAFDTWIKFYRPDENTLNTAVNYYAKGEVIAFLLDATIRRATDNARTLEDVMRRAYERYSGEHGFRRGEFRRTVEEVAGISLHDWFVQALETTEELDYTETLEWYGLRFRTDPSPDRAWLGLVTRTDGNRLFVSQVRRGTPGYDAGFNVDDEIVAIGALRVSADQWNARMDQIRPGERHEILVARRENLVRLDATFGREPPREWTLEIDPAAGESQRANLTGWLGESTVDSRTPRLD